MKKWGLLVVLVVVVVVGLALAAGQGAGKPGQESKTPESPAANAGENTGKASQANGTAPAAATGMGAMAKAAQAKRYVFLFFWKEKSEQTTAMQKVFEAALKKMADKADAAIVNITDPAEKEIVDKYELDRAPMPLVLAVAPNGAITGGFPTKFDERALAGALASPCTQKCMKALQDNKLVFLCVQNAKTKLNQDALRGVRDFQADAQYAQASELILLDPSDTAEASFLGDLKIDPKTPEAVTAFLAPPGLAIAEFKGATNKDELVATLKKASSGCCPGGACGPGGCPPKP
jgi:hypothetical protein